MALLSNELISVQPMAAPSMPLMYLDFTYDSQTKATKMRSKMRRYKIKYTNTKGVLKTRNIKATSEQKAMSQIKDMGQHHYTITEDIDDSKIEMKSMNPAKNILSRYAIHPGVYAPYTPMVSTDQVIGKKVISEKEKLISKWSTIITGSPIKSSWLEKYAEVHANAVKEQWGNPCAEIPLPLSDSYNGGFDSMEFPIIKRVYASTMQQDVVVPSNEG